MCVRAWIVQGRNRIGLGPQTSRMMTRLETVRRVKMRNEMQRWSEGERVRIWEDEDVTNGYGYWVVIAWLDCSRQRVRYDRLPGISRSRAPETAC
jgi:hypothetical protein